MSERRSTSDKLKLWSASSVYFNQSTSFSIIKVSACSISPCSVTHRILTSLNSIIVHGKSEKLHSYKKLAFFFFFFSLLFHHNNLLFNVILPTVTKPVFISTSTQGLRSSNRSQTSPFLPPTSRDGRSPSSCALGRRTQSQN